MSKHWKLEALPRLRTAMFSRLSDATHLFQQRSAVVFAPHQDDECLGCGGTIALKRNAGVPVKLVFMTDGSTSHRRFMDEDALRRLRASEAVQAAEVLGIGPADIEFLNFPDSRLGNFHPEAVTRVLGILDRHAPEEIFVPYRFDGTPDHEATFRIVREAVLQSGRPVRVCEYPVWFWNQWPWVPFPLAVSRETIRTLLRVSQSIYQLIFRRHFRTSALVAGVLDRKRQALAQHRSQTAVLVDGVGWPVLSDVSGGEFLNCFFQKCEMFHCWDSPSRLSVSAPPGTPNPGA